MHDTIQFLMLPDRRLAYQRQDASDNTKIGIIFLGGFASDMHGSKASFLATHCHQHNLPFMRFDYRGHGQSSGEFAEGTIGAWYEDALTVFDQLTQGPQIVIGSSMGGWLSLMLARDRPERVKALIGIAAAPDFTEDLMWARMTDEDRARLQRDGILHPPSAPPVESSPITWRLIEEARAHLLMREPMAINCPVRLLQGMNDAEVPHDYALRVMKAVTTEDVRVTLVKGGDHRLTRPQDLELLAQTIEEFVG